MRVLNATTLRKGLFGVMAEAVHSIPTRVRYKKGDAVILSYRQYLALKGRRNRQHSKGLKPLVAGRILKPLNDRSEEALLRYMGL